MTFAFIATYVRRICREAKPQHVPLGRALKEYAGARNRQKLLALLALAGFFLLLLLVAVKRFRRQLT